MWWQTSILITLIAFLWADKEVRSKEGSIFLIAALMNLKNHRSIILAIFFVCLFKKKTQDALP